jgi:hypothetical protein
MDPLVFSLSFCFYLCIINALSRINVHDMCKDPGIVLAASVLL